MQATVDGFMRRFGRGETVDDREAAQYHDRFVSTHDDDRDFDNKTYHDGATGYLGKLPTTNFTKRRRTQSRRLPTKTKCRSLSGIFSNSVEQANSTPSRIESGASSTWHRPR
jgi:hypothetical protein